MEIGLRLSSIPVLEMTSRTQHRSILELMQEIGWSAEPTYPMPHQLNHHRDYGRYSHRGIPSNPFEDFIESQV
jgi:hypothetical protein